MEWFTKLHLVDFLSTIDIVHLSLRTNLQTRSVKSFIPCSISSINAENLPLATTNMPDYNEEFTHSDEPLSTIEEDEYEDWSDDDQKYEDADEDVFFDLDE
jgi:hypothetical protein